MSEEARSGAPLFVVVTDGAADGASDEGLERVSLAPRRPDRPFRIKPGYRAPA